jgi:hypothetical protein
MRQLCFKFTLEQHRFIPIAQRLGNFPVKSALFALVLGIKFLDSIPGILISEIHMANG